MQITQELGKQYPYSKVTVSRESRKTGNFEVIVNGQIVWSKVGNNDGLPENNISKFYQDITTAIEAS